MANEREDAAYQLLAEGLAEPVNRSLTQRESSRLAELSAQADAIAAASPNDQLAAMKLFELGELEDRAREANAGARPLASRSESDAERQLYGELRREYDRQQNDRVTMDPARYRMFAEMNARYLAEIRESKATETR